MRAPSATVKVALIASVTALWLLVACGARTPLFVVDTAPADAARPDAFVPARDTGTAPIDTSIDTADTSLPEADVTNDVPFIDVSPLPDVVIDDCPDAGSTLIYVVTESNQLYSFYPPTGQFTLVGLLACPAGGGASPFSMAVDKQGTAYVVFDDGELFQVSTATAACVPTPYMPDQDGIPTFGMGFAGSPTGMGETLFVAPDLSGDGGDPLGTIDTASFTLSLIGPIGPQPIAEAELTGTGDGRLFAFYDTLDPNTGEQTSAVAQLDPTNARVLANNTLSDLPQGDGWAFAFWGGSFYLFTGPSTGGSIVTEFNPADLAQQTVASLPTIIVGAGVSACAPLMR